MYNTPLKATTVIAVQHKDQIAIGADGQATLGHTIAKKNVNKIRKLMEGKVIVGFAGATADAFTLLEHFEEKLNQYPHNIKKAAIALAKDWRTDRYLRKLEAMMITISYDTFLMISGTGDVIAPDQAIAAIGSGSMYAQSAALALKKHASHLSAEEIVKESLTIAADTCIYTNHHIQVASLKSKISV